MNTFEHLRVQNQPLLLSSSHRLGFSMASISNALSVFLIRRIHDDVSPPTVRMNETARKVSDNTSASICKRKEGQSMTGHALFCYILFAQFRHLLFHINIHQASKITTEDFLLGLSSELRISIAGHQVLWYLKFPEGVQSPARMPDRRLTAIENLVLTAPEHQL